MGCGMAKGGDEIGCSTGVAYGVHDTYTFTRLLRSGTYGAVFRATRRCSGEEVAVKVVSCGHDGNIDRTRRERAAWVGAGFHPNIVSLMDCYVEGKLVYFVMEFCQLSLLQAWLKEPRLYERTYAKYFVEMVDAVRHIHSLGIVHSDIKHESFLLGGQANRTVKLCDFGSACTLQNVGALATQCNGSAQYMAPEAVETRAVGGTASDVWSLGVISYVAFFGHWPYNPEQNTRQSMRKEFHSGKTVPQFRPSRVFDRKQVSSNAVQFVRGMLIRDPHARRSAAECLRMDFLAQKDIPEVEGDRRGSFQPCLKPMLKANIDSGTFNARAPQRVSDIPVFIVKQQVMAQRRREARMRCHQITSSTRQIYPVSEKSDFDDHSFDKDGILNNPATTNDGGIGDPNTTEKGIFDYYLTEAGSGFDDPFDGDFDDPFSPKADSFNAS